LWYLTKNTTIYLSKTILFAGVYLMSGSKLLEQAIVDAQALRDSAFKSAQAALLEKFAPQVKEAVEKLLEQGEEDPAAMAGSPEDAMASDIPAGTDFGGAPPDTSDKGYVAGTAKDIPLAATDGGKLCPCPDDEQEVTLELNLADLADQLKIGKEAEEEEDVNNQPNLTGMQDQPPAAGGAALAESVELEEEFELEEELDENLTEVNLDEVWSENEKLEEEELEEEKELSAKQKKIAKAAPPEDKITGADFKALKKEQKIDESKTKQLLQASAQLLKEHQNSVKLMEKKDAQIQKLLEENKKSSSTIEEMSVAFKKLEQVNTLNARLFYENQILKSASLNERQKTHIVEAISKADSVSEAKTIYETLVNSVGGPAKEERSPKSLNEAINKKSSFRLPHKQSEQPNDSNKDRWLKLAGIK
jgi:hypothetical protein